MRHSSLRGLFMAGIVFCSLQAQALRLQYFAETSIPTGTKFNKTVIGGLSGMVWQNNTLYALSDDKGRDGDPRFYEFDLKLGKSIDLKPKAVHFITGLPKEGERKALLDPEGLARLPSGDLLIASEGSTDAKPRAMPRVFRVSPDGKWKDDLPIPDKYLPEKIGQQTKGVQNNLAFEGLSTWADGKYVFVGTEATLVQEQGVAKGNEGSLVRILKLEDKGQATYRPVAEYVYQLDPLSSNDKGLEVMRGVSEILTVSESKLLVLERGVRVQSKGWHCTVAIYLVDLSKASSVLENEKLSAGHFQIAAKTKLVDFEVDLNKERAGKSVQNFEALSWGPPLPDGRRSLLVMVDNNFSKREITELVVFAVEGE